MASIRCAHCTDTHATVAQVRVCAQEEGQKSARSVRSTRTLHGVLNDAREIEEPNWNWGSRVRHEDAARQDTFAADESLDQDTDHRPKLATLRELEQQVPAGHYAVTGTDNTTKFYFVDKPQDGRWKGYTFLKLQLSDDYQSVKIPSMRQGVFQQIIDQGVQKSMERYGREIGRCGHCDRTLTNAESIARGIGPICAGKMGW